MNKGMSCKKAKAKAKIRITTSKQKSIRRLRH